jgi:uncharacterized membrane protein YecN with MAPEG domain
LAGDAGDQGAADLPRGARQLAPAGGAAGALLLLALCEINGLPGWALHVLGVVLVAARIAHAAGIAREPENFRWRVPGTSLTFTMMGVAAAALLGPAVAAL